MTEPEFAKFAGACLAADREREFAAQTFLELALRAHAECDADQRSRLAEVLDRDRARRQAHARCAGAVA